MTYTKIIKNMGLMVLLSLSTSKYALVHGELNANQLAQLKKRGIKLNDKDPSQRNLVERLWFQNKITDVHKINEELSKLTPAYMTEAEVQEKIKKGEEAEKIILEKKLLEEKIKLKEQRIEELKKAAVGDAGIVSVIEALNSKLEGIKTGISGTVDPIKVKELQGAIDKLLNDTEFKKLQTVIEGKKSTSSKLQEVLEVAKQELTEEQHKEIEEKISKEVEEQKKKNEEKEKQKAEQTVSFKSKLGAITGGNKQKTLRPLQDQIAEQKYWQEDKVLKDLLKELDKDLSKDVGSMDLTDLEALSSKIQETQERAKKRMEQLKAAQHPEGVTKEMIAAAIKLFNQLSAEVGMSAGVSGGGMLPPPPPPGDGPPPPPPGDGPPPPPMMTGGNKKTLTLQEQDNFKEQFKKLDQNITKTLKMVVGLGEGDISRDDYKQFILKTVKDRQLLDKILKITDEGMKTLLSGSLSDDALYGYYLYVIGFLSDTDKQRFSPPQWTKDNLKAVRSVLISYVDYVHDTLEAAINKAKEAEQKKKDKKPEEDKGDKKTEATLVQPFVNGDEALLELWRKDPDLKLIPNTAKDLTGMGMPFPNVVTTLTNFLKTQYKLEGINPKTILTELEKQKIDETTEPTHIISSVRNILKKLLQDSGYKASDQFTFPAAVFEDNDYQALLAYLLETLENSSSSELDQLKDDFASGKIESSADLTNKLKELLKKIVEPVVKSSVELDEIQGGGQTYRRFSFGKIQQNKDLSPAAENAFHEVDGTIKQLGNAYKNQLTLYDEGKSIWPPSSGLIDVLNPKLKKSLENYKTTTVAVDDKFYDALYTALGKLKSKEESNDQYKLNLTKIVKSVKVISGGGEDLKTLVTRTFRSIAGINVHPIIPPEAQSLGSNYVLLKTFLTFKLFTDIPNGWKIKKESTGTQTKQGTGTQGNITTGSTVSTKGPIIKKPTYDLNNLKGNDIPRLETDITNLSKKTSRTKEDDDQLKLMQEALDQYWQKEEEAALKDPNTTLESLDEQMTIDIQDSNALKTSINDPNQKFDKLRNEGKLQAAQKRLDRNTNLFKKKASQEGGLSAQEKRIEELKKKVEILDNEENRTNLEKAQKVLKRLESLGIN
jgi:hypothetical protein